MENLNVEENLGKFRTYEKTGPDAYAPDIGVVKLDGFVGILI